MTQHEPMGMPEVRDISERAVRIELLPRQRAVIQEGSSKDFTCIVPISEALERVLHLRKEIELPEGMFVKKAEYHATALGFGHRERIKEALAHDPNIITKINAILSSTDFSFVVKTDSAKLVNNLEYNPDAVRAGTSFESEATIAIDIEMPGMVAFYEKMRELGIDLGSPPPHVTLYKKENGDASGLGIAIYDIAKQQVGEMSPKIRVQPIAFDRLKE